jgi:hypothetical protein
MPHKKLERFAFSSVAPIAPGLAAAVALSISDVLAKIIFAARYDVLTMLSFRSLVGIVVMTAWLRLGSKPAADARVRLISLGIGVLFTALIFCLFKSIEANDVPTAVLTYFVYPLLTGLVAWATGLERLRWQGAACALAAFAGLAIMIGAHPAGLDLTGIAYGLAAACCRTGVLIVTRAFLAGADARLTTWYSVLAQFAIAWHANLATAANRHRLDRLARHERGDDGQHPVYFRVDDARRRISHRAHHEPRALDCNGAQRRCPCRSRHAAASARQRRHACCAGGVPNMAVMAWPRRRVVTRNSLELSQTRPT